MSAPTFANAPETLGSAPAGFLPERLEREVRKIYARSPLYGRRFQLHRDPLQWSCYREIPALSKKDIVTEGHQAFFTDFRADRAGHAGQALRIRSTGGTTQSPMTVIMEEGWWNAQTERAYRASPILREFAGRPYRKCVLAPVGCSSNLCPYEDHPFPHRYFDGVVYLNLVERSVRVSRAENGTASCASCRRPSPR
jgi:phenylacetate-CoA ligase